MPPTSTLSQAQTEEESAGRGSPWVQGSSRLAGGAPGSLGLSLHVPLCYPYAGLLAFPCSSGCRGSQCAAMPSDPSEDKLLLESEARP